LRNRFLENNIEEEFQSIARAAEVGYLGITDSNGFPRVVPLNFVTSDKKVYFHGASYGEKYSLFKARAKVTFCVSFPYSIIPSHWLNKEHACPATTFYKSGLINGYGGIVENTKEKALALQLLMEKYQPEGSYRSISADEKKYSKALQKTAILQIEPIKIIVKANLGQNKSDEIKKLLIEKLRERNKGLDILTANEVEKIR